jgi:hypothetical protein
MFNHDVEQKVDEILQNLSPEDSKYVIQATVTKVLDEVKDALLNRAFERAMRSSGLSDAVVLAADELAKRTGDSEEDLLLKALSLYEAALEGKEKGQRLILVGPDYKFIKEIVGFEKTSPEPVERESVAS